MAVRDLIITFFNGVPKRVLRRFANPPLVLDVSPLKTDEFRQAFYVEEIQKWRARSGSAIQGAWNEALRRGILRGTASKQDTLGRVAVTSFSRGGVGGREMLKGPDAASLDAVFFFDATLGPYDPPGSGHLSSGSFLPIITHGQRAAQTDAGPLLVITHSSIVTPRPGNKQGEPSFPTTTETANTIWDAVYPEAPLDVPAWVWDDLDRITLPNLDYPQGYKVCPPGRPCFSWAAFGDGWYDQRVVGGFNVFGWGDPITRPRPYADERSGQPVSQTRDPLGTADHIHQAQLVLASLLDVYLTKRWGQARWGRAAPTLSFVWQPSGKRAVPKPPRGVATASVGGPGLYAAAVVAGAAAGYYGVRWARGWLSRRGKATDDATARRQ